MLKRSLHLILFTLLSLVFSCQVALAQEGSWQTYYEAAEKAYAANNLFEARRMFMVALKQADQDKQHIQLAARVEGLAASYIAQDKHAQAQPLFKLVRKLRSN